MADDRLDPRTGLFLVQSVGVSDTDARQFRRSVDRGQGTRLRRGVFTTADRWGGLAPQDRYLGMNPRRATPEMLVYPDELSEMLARCGSVRGSTKAQRAIDFARPNSDNPGESLSRVAIFELGFPDPEWQCRHPNPQGWWYFTDFEWPRFQLIGEFDGRGKYLKDEYLHGRAPGDVVYAEKVGEDHLRAEGFGVVRWGAAELANRGALSRLLVAAGLPVIR